LTSSSGVGGVVAAPVGQRSGQRPKMRYLWWRCSCGHLLASCGAAGGKRGTLTLTMRHTHRRSKVSRIRGVGMLLLPAPQTLLLSLLVRRVLDHECFYYILMTPPPKVEPSKASDMHQKVG